MAGPTVTLTFAGDEKKLTEAMERVGKSSKSMSEDVGQSSEKMRDAGKDLEGLRDRAGDTEQRFIGFKDTITGTGDVIKGFQEGSVLTMAQGFADIAGGLESFLIPALGSLAGFLAGPLRAAMTFIAAHPLLIALGLLAAAFVFLWTRSETFRNIVIGVFNTVASFVRNVFGGAINWIVDRWNDVIAFFRNIPVWIGNALSGIGSVISAAFRGALNVAIDIINWFVDRANDLIYGINVISPFTDIPYIPKIRRLHQGGIVGGAPGTEQLAILQAGERVIPANQRDGGSGVLEVQYTGNTDTAVASMIQYLVRTGKIKLKVA